MQTQCKVPLRNKMQIYGPKDNLEKIKWQISAVRHCEGLTVAVRTREIGGKKMSYKMYVPSVNLVSAFWMNVSYNQQESEGLRPRAR